MKFHKLITVLSVFAGLADEALARENAYLREENRILRSKLPKRITVTPKERGVLLRFGSVLGRRFRDVISIVHPKTFERWKRETRGRVPPERKRIGRPRTNEEIRVLIIRMAAENPGWSPVRIFSELKRLGIHRVSIGTVRNIMRESGFFPDPDRSFSTWDNFIKRHMSTLWACDFFTKDVWTIFGKTTFYIFFFIHLGSRKVHLVNMTRHPDADWMKQQARNFFLSLGDNDNPKISFEIATANTRRASTTSSNPAA